MSKEKNALMDAQFNELGVDKKKELLGLNDTVLSQSRFRGLAIETVINDVWNGKTNSQRRALLKAV